MKNTMQIHVLTESIKTNKVKCSTKSRGKIILRNDKGIESTSIEITNYRRNVKEAIRLPCPIITIQWITSDGNIFTWAGTERNLIEMIFNI